jgi:hypothetical protein
MPKKDSRPAGMRARRNRDGTSTFYMVRPDGEKLILGQDLRIACSRWLEEQHARTKAVSPRTALSLLDAFGKCSLPLDSEQATARRIREVTILQEFFSECGDPPLDVIGSEHEFLAWYQRSKRATPADRVVRMLRLVWKFALQLEITHDDCPWKSVDFSKGRLQMEAVDVVDAFASSQLKELTQELLGNSQTESLAYRCANSAAHREQLRSELIHAKDRSVTALRACGRLDLVRPVFQLDLESLLALLDLPHLASVRPPGRILLGHERAIALRSLRAKSDHLMGAIGQADELTAVGQSDNLPEEGL